MKLKYYLRGLGIGIIVTTLILMIAFALHPKDEMTDEQIIAQAKKLGMVMKETEKPIKDTLAGQAGLKEEKEEKEESEKQDNAGNQSPDKEEKQPKEATDDKKDKTPKKETVEKVEVSIVGGEYSDKVSEKLEKAGLIDDAETFNKYLAECGSDSLIQPGNYVLTIGSSYDEIIEEITKKD